MRLLSLESDILESLMRKKEADATQIANELGVKTEKVVSTLKRLKASGLIITS